MFKNAEVTNLEGTSYAAQIGTGTNNVVTVIENTDGVMIKLGSSFSSPNHSYAGIKIGGNSLIESGNISGGSSFGAPTPVIENIFIPAGVAVDLVVSGASGSSWIHYEVY